MRALFHTRIRILTILVIAGAVLIVGRLYFVQIVHGSSYNLEADRQYVRPNQQLYDRGSIFFTAKDGGRVSAAGIRSGFLVAIKPGEVEDPAAAFAALSALLPDLSEEDFLARASKTDDPYEEIARHLTDETAAAIRELDIPGVRVYRERWRIYPGGELAAQTVGFVGYDGDAYNGRYGLERFYDETLSRKHEELYVNFFAEIFANVHRTLASGGGARSGDIITGIEPSVQLALHDELAELVADWNARDAAGIIIDPRTGAIYALGQEPSFDINAYGEVEDASVYSNMLVERVFELGSIIKALTMASGLDAGVVTPDTEYIDHGYAEYDTAVISNYDGKARGKVDMQEVLNQSLNTGAAYVMEQLGTDTFAEYFRRFGFDEKSGIDLPNEAHNLIGNLESPRTIEYATASFGQGLALTPISAVRALSALAGGGRLITPHIAQRIDYSVGLSEDMTPAAGERVISEAASDAITRMLVAVVDDALAGGDVALPHYSIAAKTGTAQIPDHINGGYRDDVFLHSFFGYFPAYEPRFLVFLMVREPHGVRYASQTLTEPFMDLVRFLINYYDVPPDR